MKEQFYPIKSRPQIRFTWRIFSIFKFAFLFIFSLLFNHSIVAQNSPECNNNISAAGTVIFDANEPNLGCFMNTEGGCLQITVSVADIPDNCAAPALSFDVGQGCGGNGGNFIAFDMDCMEVASGEGVSNLVVPLDMAPLNGDLTFILCRPGMGPILLNNLAITGCCVIEGTCNLQDEPVEGCTINDLPPALTDPADIFADFVSDGCTNPTLIVEENILSNTLPIIVSRTYTFFEDANQNGVFDAGEINITCTQELTIDDTTLPTALCQDVTIQLDVTGTAFLFPINADPTMSVDNGSFDACGLADPAFTLSQSLFTCDDLGVVTVTLTVEDVNGNIATCTADITVEDNVQPSVTCQNVILQLDENGNATLNPDDAVAAINEACGPVTITASQTEFNCMNLTNAGFPNIVSIMVEDGSGNVGNCNAAIFVEDNIDPTAICENVTVILNEFGSGNTSANDVGGNSFDNCTIVSIELSQVNFMCADVGNNAVTLTVTDNSGNVSTCDAVVTVLDLMPPVPVCMPFQAELDANGIATIDLSDVLASASDNCGLLPGGQVTQDAFNCAELGNNTVTVSVTDVNGLTGSCQATVTVVDLINPVALCQDLTIDLDVNGFASITADQIDAGSSDNCNMITLAVSPNTFFCGNVGPNFVTLVVTDQSNNVATCTAIVTVRDLIPPVAVCQDVTIFLDENGEAVVTPGQVDNGSSDACGIASLVLSQTDFDCDDIGNNNTVILTVTDVNGNVSTCTADITVVDAIPAVILCRPPVNTVNDPGICGADVLLLPPLVIEENCSIIDVSNNAPNPFPIGTTLVTWTLTDAGGNQTTCLQSVTVNDTEDPVIDCGNSFTAFTSWDNCGYPSYLLEPATATDNCGVVSLTNDAPSFFPPGQYMVNYTATDAAGNSATCMQWVKIYDTTLPKLLSCPEDQTVFATTTFGAFPTWALPTGMDNCPGDLIIIEANGYVSGNFFALGDTEVSYRLYDPYGNFVECAFTISVVPQPLPLTMNCLETIEISTQQEVNLQNILWNSPLVQSLCEDCEILKSDDFDFVGGFEGHNYYLYNSDELSWNEAQQLANSLGGYLTVINSAKENLFLATELEEDVTPWIGLADVQGNGSANWADGSAYEQQGWQEDISLIANTPTGFVLNEDGEWKTKPAAESHYFLFEIPCYEVEISNDNDLNIAQPNSETTVTYQITDQCGNTVDCDFELIFTSGTVDYCTEGSVVVDSAAQHFINYFLIQDHYNNGSGNNYGYGDFTDEYILLAPGEIVDIYANFGPLDVDNPLYCRMWIDLNGDGDFYDEGELIGQAIDILEMQSEWTVPNVNQSIQQTRLRIAIARFGYPEPCGAYADGEVEDYTITFDHNNSALYTQVNLQGQREGFSSQLSWVTQTNVDISSYDIERSKDGVNFEKIKTGISDETTKTQPAVYHSKDNTPDTGFNFYRLEVFPVAGQPFYSNIVSLKFNDKAQRLTIYPNPADEFLMMNIEDANGKAATLRLINTLGQELKQISYDEITDEEIRLNLDNLTDGTYYLHFTIEGQHTVVEKVVIDKLNGYRPRD